MFIALGIGLGMIICCVMRTSSKIKLNALKKDGNEKIISFFHPNW